MCVGSVCVGVNVVHTTLYLATCLPAHATALCETVAATVDSNNNSVTIIIVLLFQSIYGTYLFISALVHARYGSRAYTYVTYNMDVVMYTHTHTNTSSLYECAEHVDACFVVHSVGSKYKVDYYTNIGI